MKVVVVVKYHFEAIHHWPECDLDEVGFLRHPHRHLFHVRAEKEVAHNDRAIEIIMLKRKMEAYSKELSNYGRMSCEDIATDLVTQFNLSMCEVLEDNENGAKVIL